jgi:putative cell wall-binding protein
VESALSAAGVTVTRLAGVNRYDTARVVAQEVASELGAAWHETVFIARGDDFPDALALAPIAYSQKAPVLLVKPHDITAQTSTTLVVLGVQDAIIAGGTAAVGDEVKDLLDTILTFTNGGSASTRLAGADRYGTASAVADYGLGMGWVDTSFMGVASGQDFPDALSGGVAAGVMYGSMLLTRKTSLPSTTGGFVNFYANGDTDVRVFGGTATVSASVMDGIGTLY